MSQPRKVGTRRFASWAERSLWALGLSLAGYWIYSQAAIRLEQARLEESFFAAASTSPASSAQDDVAAGLAGSVPADLPVLERGAPVGLIEIARIDVRAMVVEGVDDHSLQRAVGHIPGTALPGAPGNSVMAAHRDTLFAGLRHVQIGDHITLRTGPSSYSYRVSAIDVVPPDAVHVLEQTTERVLTLITCFPFDFVGPAPMRFIVSAVQEAAGEPTLAREAIAPGGAQSAPETSPSPRRLDPEAVAYFSAAFAKAGGS